MDFLSILKSNKESEEEINLEESLSFLEDVLKEEDPEFVNQLNEIKIQEQDANLQSESVYNKIIDIENQKNKKLEKLKNLLKYLFLPFNFKKHPKKAIGFWLLVGLVFAGKYFLIQKILYSGQHSLFINSYADFGIEVYDYDIFDETEYYFENPQFAKNFMSLTKLVTNIKPTEESSDNPMLSADIVFESLSSEPIVEIKDREAEFRDLVLRLIENFNYDELVEADGKSKLASTILEAVNAQLSKGQIRKVFYNQFIVKN